jgi:hypothetical protein
MPGLVDQLVDLERNVAGRVGVQLVWVTAGPQAVDVGHDLSIRAAAGPH